MELTCSRTWPQRVRVCAFAFVFQLWGGVTVDTETLPDQESDDAITGNMADVWARCAVPEGFFPFRMPWYCEVTDAEAQNKVPIPAESTGLQYPIRGHVFSDADFSDLTCDFPSPIKWQKIRDFAWQVSAVESIVRLQEMCQETYLSLDAFNQEGVGGDFTMPPLYGLVSDHASDCAFGVVAYTIIGFICTYGSVSLGEHEDLQVQAHLRAWWMTLCLQVEGLFFYMEVPLMSIAASAWPIFHLFRLVGNVLVNFEGAPPNKCDMQQSHDSLPFLEKLRACLKSGREGVLFQEAALAAHQLLHDREERAIFQDCHFAPVAAILLLEAGDLGSGRLSVAHQIIRAWEQKNKYGFFWDLFTTQWGLWHLGVMLGTSLKKRGYSRASASTTVDQVSQTSELNRLLLAEGHPRQVLWPAQPELQPCNRNTWDGLPPVNFSWPWSYKTEHLSSALCNLKNKTVFFMSTWFGSERQHSYAMRARQVSRGLRRVLGIRAEACLASCSSCCDRLALCLFRNASGCRLPSVFVHIKGICECAVQSFPRSVGVVHILDPIDTWVQSPPLFNSLEGSLDPYKEVSGLFAETSLSAKEYAEHPSIRPLGWKVFHLPHHHTNLARRAIKCAERVSTVGVHSTQLDPELRAGIETLLVERFPEVRFQHINPMLRFEGADQRYSPSPWNAQIAEQMLDELLNFDVTLAKPNCYEPTPEETLLHQFRFRAWLCERHQGGQRLVHALAAGLPTVVWGGSQGFMDVVSPSRSVPLAYTNREMIQNLGLVLENRSLRCQLSAEAQRLAEPFHIDRTVERYALAFDHLIKHLEQERGDAVRNFGVGLGWMSWRSAQENPKDARKIPDDGGVRRRGNRGEKPR